MIILLQSMAWCYSRKYCYPSYRNSKGFCPSHLYRSVWKFQFSFILPWDVYRCFLELHILSFCTHAVIIHLIVHFVIFFRKPTRILNIDGKECLNFATFNFLGFVGNEQIEVLILLFWIYTTPNCTITRYTKSMGAWTVWSLIDKVVRQTIME